MWLDSPCPHDSARPRFLLEPENRVPSEGYSEVRRSTVLLRAISDRDAVEHGLDVNVIARTVTYRDPRSGEIQGARIFVRQSSVSNAGTEPMKLRGALIHEWGHVLGFADLTVDADSERLVVRAMRSHDVTGGGAIERPSEEERRALCDAYRLDGKAQQE